VVKFGGTFLVALLWVGVVISDDLKSDPATLIERLQSQDRSVRVAALEECSVAPVVAEKTADAVVFALRREAEEVFASTDAKPVGAQLADMTKVAIPVDPADTSVVRISSDPARFYDEVFTLTCGICPSDSYPPAGVYERADYLSFYLDQFTPQGTFQASNRGRAFLLRDFGGRLSQGVSTGIEGGATHTVAQLKCTTRKVNSLIGDADQMIEILDFRGYSPKDKKWGYWTFEGISLAFLALKHCETPPVQHLISIVIAERPYANKGVDILVRDTAIELLATLDPPSDVRVSVTEDLTRKRKQAANNLDGSPSRLIPRYDKLLALFKPAKTSPKPPSPEKKAASLLQVARNHQKNGNKKAAIGSLKQVIKDFPDTPSAIDAKADLKKIEP
jgi:hypothetical protein